MNSIFKKVKWFAILLIFPVIAIVGCEPSQIFIGPIITGITYWVNGEAHRYYEENTDVLYRSTKHALRELNLPITKDKKNNNSYSIIAGEKNRFSIQINEADKGLTKVDIRINFWGDKDFADLIYKKVGDQLTILEFDKNGNPTRQFR